jgi:2-amino-4-hydroxy-6-hydroxymethyldihydropteridine diphosphokinase
LILIGIGANLPSPSYGKPRATCGAALTALAAADLVIAARSRWYRSAPVPASDQPWYVNAVVRVQTALAPGQLLALLLATEQAFGRRRGELNAARVLDLDLLTYGDLVTEEGTKGLRPVLTLPHPRLEKRAFVLLPMRDVAPDWRHPVAGTSLEEMIAALDKTETAEAMADAAGVFGTEWHAPAHGDGRGNR